MFTGREKELQYLNDFYARKGSHVLVVYGQKGIGKTTLLKYFSKDKAAVCYEAVSVSIRQQCEFFLTSLSDMGFSCDKKEGFDTVIETIEEKMAGKKGILIIDEFHHMCKAELDFFVSLERFLKKENKKSELLIILCTSMTDWTNNTMKIRLESFSYMITEVYKVNELSYSHFKMNFPGFSVFDSITAYGMLGGIPGLWKYFKDNISIRENIENAMLHPEGKLFQYGQEWVEAELRETSVYNTILTAMATGKDKLNDLYLHTGFSRAKISVYLKQLIHLQFVEKADSVVTEKKGFTRKGVYRICQPYLNFYYRFLFPNMAAIQRLGKGDFYTSHIEPVIPAFTEGVFKQVCREYIEKENDRGRLPGRFTYLGSWYGKMGDIDFIYQEDEAEEVLAGICNWKEEIMTYEMYRTFEECQEKSQIRADYMILFSKSDFDPKLKEEARTNPRLALINAKTLGELL